MTATPPIASSHAPSVVSSCERDDEKPSAFSTGQSCMLSICYPLYGVPSRSHFPLPTSLLPTSYSPLPTSLLPTSLLPTSHFLLPSYSPLPTSHFLLPTSHVSRLTGVPSRSTPCCTLTYLLAYLLTYLLTYLLGVPRRSTPCCTMPSQARQGSAGRLAAIATMRPPTCRSGPSRTRLDGFVNRWTRR